MSQIASEVDSPIDSQGFYIEGQHFLPSHKRDHAAAEEEASASPPSRTGSKKLKTNNGKQLLYIYFYLYHFAFGIFCCFRFKYLWCL